MKKTKIFAAYLPQYHETEDNNAFWGKGFTDWIAVKNCRPLFKDHRQPRIPLDNRYYDLSDKQDIQWQTTIAKQYGIDGFNIYHYWFKDGKQELERPAEIILENKDIDICYFFTWDTNSWVRSWSGISGNAWTTEYGENVKKEKKVLVPFEYGTKKDWDVHYDYLNKFFCDERYYKINGKPVFVFFGTNNEHIIEMSRYWNRRAVEMGFPGLYIVTQSGSFKKHQRIDAEFVYEPSFSVWSRRDTVMSRIKKCFHIRNKERLTIYSYKGAWIRVYKDNKRKMKDEFVPGCFVAYDDSPRRGKNARIIKARNIQSQIMIFEKYFGMLYNLCCQQDKEFMLITAWNEWGEGAYLEPDAEVGFSYLEAIQKVKKCLQC